MAHAASLVVADHVGTPLRLRCALCTNVHRTLREGPHQRPDAAAYDPGMSLRLDPTVLRGRAAVPGPQEGKCDTSGTNRATYLARIQMRCAHPSVDARRRNASASRVSARRLNGCLLR